MVSEEDSIEERRRPANAGSRDARGAGPKAAASHSRRVQFQPKDVVVLDFGGGKGKTVTAPSKCRRSYLFVQNSFFCIHIFYSFSLLTCMTFFTVLTVFYRV